MMPEDVMYCISTDAEKLLANYNRQLLAVDNTLNFCLSFAYVNSCLRTYAKEIATHFILITN